MCSDDSFIVSPFDDAFQFIAAVPYSVASKVLGILNGGRNQKRRRELSKQDFNFAPLTGDACPDETLYQGGGLLRPRSRPLTRSVHSRESPSLTPGYLTTGASFSMLTS